MRRFCPKLHFWSIDFAHWCLAPTQVRRVRQCRGLQLGVHEEHHPGDVPLLAGPPPPRPPQRGRHLPACLQRPPQPCTVCPSSFRMDSALQLPYFVMDIPPPNNQAASWEAIKSFQPSAACFVCSFLLPSGCITSFSSQKWSFLRHWAS